MRKLKLIFRGLTQTLVMRIRIHALTFAQFCLEMRRKTKYDFDIVRKLQSSNNLKIWRPHFIFKMQASFSCGSEII